MLSSLGSQWQQLGERALARLGAALAEQGVGAPVAVSSDNWQNLCAYLDLLVTWNNQVDLTAARSNEELIDLMLADAFVLAACAGQGQSWVDVGAGAGAPGASLAILRPDLNVTLVEPLQKRTAFLRVLAGTLSRVNLQVQRARAQDLPASGWFTAVSRATFEPQEWLTQGARLAQAEVWLLLARAQPPELPGWAVTLDVAYDWPLGGAPRRVLQYEREKA